MTLNPLDEEEFEAVETISDEEGRPLSPQLLRIYIYGARGDGRRLASECARGETWVFWDDDVIIPAVYLVPDPDEPPGDKLIFPYVDDAAPRGAQHQAPIVDGSGAHRSQTAAEYLDGLIGPARPAILIIDNFESFRTLEGAQTPEAVHAWAEKNGVLIAGIDYKAGDPSLN